jgi:hypothetical protein
MLQLLYISAHIEAMRKEAALCDVTLSIILLQRLERQNTFYLQYQHCLQPIIDYFSATLIISQSLPKPYGGWQLTMITRSRASRYRIIRPIYHYPSKVTRGKERNKPHPSPTCTSNEGLYNCRQLRFLLRHLQQHSIVEIFANAHILLHMKKHSAISI